MSGDGNAQLSRLHFSSSAAGAAHQQQLDHEQMDCRTTLLSIRRIHNKCSCHLLAAVRLRQAMSRSPMAAAEYTASAPKPIATYDARRW